MSSIDLKYCLRALLRAPLSSIAIVLTLALGIGGSTAIFAVVNAVLLGDLSFPAADRLVAVNEFSVRSGSYSPASMRGVFAYGQDVSAVAQLAAYRTQAVSVSGAGAAELVAGALVTTTFFDVLGTSPLLGRTFQETDADGAVVLSFEQWQTRFRADPAVVGKALLVDGTSGTVAGVMRPDFHFPDMKCRIWRLITKDYTLARDSPDYRFLRVIGRLRETARPAGVRAQLEVARSRLAEQTPDLYRNLSVAVLPLKEDMVGSVRPTLSAVGALVALVLVIACVNTAILQIARTSHRSHEFATRVALGAKPWQVISVVLQESAVLSLAGGAVGLLLAAASLKLVLAFSPFRIPRAAEIGIDARAVVFMMAALLLTSMISGLVPARHLLRPASWSLNSRGSISHAAKRTLGMLVVLEVASATILLTGALLAVQSFLRLATVDIGFPTDGLLTASVRLQKAQYPTRASLDGFQARIYDRVAAIPGVKDVAGSTHLPLVSGFLNYIGIRDSPEESQVDRELVGQSAVSPGYFHAMGIRLLMGREFDRFSQGSERVAVVNESMSRQYWPNQSPLGRQIRLGLPRESSPWFTIVGVVSDVHHFGLGARPRPTVFLPYMQIPPAYEQQLSRATTLAIRTTMDPTVLVPSIRRAVAEIDPDLATEIRTMNDLVSEAIAPQRFPTVVVTVFAAIALWLAGLGLHLVMANMAARRMAEMGLRVALGASPDSIVWLVLRTAVILVAIGLVVGTAGALLLWRSWRSVLPDSPALNFGALAWTALLLIVTSVLAAYPSARKASRSDPMTIIRAE